ncbi:TetR family transcriptional regulator [Actinospica robiniae]|uniref:TetR/AcrR family transcriptional regulator n=1 Tax=Actinospica robiniae TaxID=304901 RepID=UPI0003FF8B97|nr:TetR family transcriptional regulator [Actinospica robiniae]
MAAAAGIDPALVIRYFGSKQGLFQSAARLPDAATEPESPETLAVRLSKAAPGPDAELRAGLTATMMLGVAIGRQMLDLPSLTQASVSDIQRVMQPALRAVME